MTLEEKLFRLRKLREDAEAADFPAMTDKLDAAIQKLERENAVTTRDSQENDTHKQVQAQEHICPVCMDNPCCCGK